MKSPKALESSVRGLPLPSPIANTLARTLPFPSHTKKTLPSRHGPCSAGFHHFLSGPGTPQRLSATFPLHKSERKPAALFSPFSTAANDGYDDDHDNGSNAPPAEQNKNRLLLLVDVRGVGSVRDHLRLYTDPYFRRYEPPAGPHLVVSDKPSDEEYPGRYTVGPYSAHARRLAFLVSLRRRSPLRVSLTEIYDAYRVLPEPRMLCLSAALRHKLLAVLGRPVIRTAKTMLRYFAVVSEVKNCGLTLTRQEWNYALSLAGKCASWTTPVELDSAVRLWREMEAVAGIRANDVTFNILFDLASKTGNFSLAEMLLHEMDARKIPYDRFHHVGLINFFGLKLDADGVRAAYKEMVDAGEMIDTLALNCVINGLLRCGEEASAQAVYRGMQDSAPRPGPPPQRDYMSQIVVTKTLKMLGSISRRHARYRTALQNMVSTRPNHRTYRILVNHFALKMGDLKVVVRLLDEMKWNGVLLDGAAFATLFKAFQRHGSRLGSSWSEQRLVSVFEAFLASLRKVATDVVLTRALSMWVLRAFAKCSSPSAVYDAYLRMKGLERYDEDTTQVLEHAVSRLMAESDALY